MLHNLSGAGLGTNDVYVLWAGYIPQAQIILSVGQTVLNYFTRNSTAMRLQA